MRSSVPKPVVLGLLLCGIWLATASGCGGDNLYAPCEVAYECVSRGFVPEEETPVCLPKAGAGFCTWLCSSDADCLEDADRDFDYVCAPFESNPDSYCFPSCEDTDGLCPPGYGCRSTGGGSDNRKICFPL